MPLPPLITTTPESRRVYPCDLVINKQRLFRLIIDPHFEEKHGSYVNDELIWKLVQQLNNHTRLKDQAIINISPLRIFSIKIKVIV